MISDDDCKKYSIPEEYVTKYKKAVENAPKNCIVCGGYGSDYWTAVKPKYRIWYQFPDGENQYV